jgi:hypothetical protein
MWNFSRLFKNQLLSVLEGRGAKIGLGLPFMYPFMPFLDIRVISIFFSTLCLELMMRCAYVNLLLCRIACCVQ